MDDLDLLESILGKKNVESEEWKELIKLIRKTWNK
jgi:succinate dehydrogenase flavin-adding protein (antitoxin of CptAB toxin-antitoxin module)